MMDAFNGQLYVSNQYSVGGGVRASSTVYHSGSRVSGQVYIRNLPDLSFTMAITHYHTDGSWDVVYFDCKNSSDGASLTEGPGLDIPYVTLPGTGTGAVPSTVVGDIETRGAMSTLASNKFLLRIDVTNRGTQTNFADIDLALDGYAVEGFPALPAGITCQPMVGLFCSLKEVAPGSTQTMVLLLQAGSDEAKTASIDLTVLNAGYRKIALTDGGIWLNRSVSVSNMYNIARP